MTDESDTSTILKACRERSNERWAENTKVMDKMKMCIKSMDDILRGQNGDPGVCEQVRQSAIGFKWIIALLLANMALGVINKFWG